MLKKVISHHIQSQADVPYSRKGNSIFCGNWGLLVNSDVKNVNFILSFDVWIYTSPFALESGET
jgi:hypothetical protein